MSRSLITKWDDLSSAGQEGDRLSIFVCDVTGKWKFIDCYVSGVYLACDAEFQDERQRWPATLVELDELRNNPRVNTLLVALRKIRDKAPTLEAAQTIATIAIEEYIKSGGCDVSGVRR